MLPSVTMIKIYQNGEFIDLWLKNKIFKQGIGITEKSLETRRDHWGGNVNPKSLF